MTETANAVTGGTSAGQSVQPVKVIHSSQDHVPTFHADGGWGVNNQHGMVRVSFYTENPPVPTSYVQQVHPDGSPKGEPQMEGPDVSKYYVVVRDFQCNVVMPISAAVQVHQMLGNYLETAKQQLAEQVKVMEMQIRQAVPDRTEPARR